MTRAQRLTLTATILGSSMAFIDGSVVNVALPRLQAELGASPATTAWIINAYLLVLGSVVLVGGALADRYGRRRCFVIGIAIFAMASVGCGVASGAPLLLVSRGVQGLGAALLTPSSLGLLGATFDRETRGRAIGTWAGFGALASALGPVLGGWLVDQVSWRAIFFINLPFAAAAATCALVFAEESRGHLARHLDLAGCVAAIAALTSLTWGLTAAPDRSFTDPYVIAALGVGLLLTAGFLVVESRLGEDAMLPLATFRVSAFAAANGLTLLLYFALSGALFFLPFALIRIGKYPATSAGASLLPFACIMFAGSGLAGRIRDRFGARLPLVVGPMVAGLGFVALGLAHFEGPYITQVFPAVVILSIGMTLTVAPLTTTVMSALDDAQAGVASGVNNAVARIGGLLAIAVFGIVLAVAFGLVLRDTSPDETHLALTNAMTGAAVPPEVSQAFARAISIVMFTAGVCAAFAGIFGLYAPARRR